MKKRSIFLIITIIGLSIIMATTPALAGSAQHNRWEGVAIGISAAIIGSALYKQYKSQPPQVYSDQRSGYHRSPPVHHRYGFWEIQKEWMPPTYKKVWNPAHYDERGRWVDGCWIKIIDETGYWVEKRVWVSRRPGRHLR